jgi:hypothetical protein
MWRLTRTAHPRCNVPGNKDSPKRTNYTFQHQHINSSTTEGTTWRGHAGDCDVETAGLTTVLPLGNCVNLLFIVLHKNLSATRILVAFLKINVSISITGCSEQLPRIQVWDAEQGKVIFSGFFTIPTGEILPTTYCQDFLLLALKCDL